MRLLFSLGVVLFAGCSTAPKVPHEVAIPVSIPCRIELPGAPDYRFQGQYENIFDAVKDLLGDREVSLAYEAQLREAIKACQ